MPFIRYRVGDIGVPSNKDCECGIKLPTMKLIEGRTDMMLTLPGNRILSPRNFTLTINTFQEINKVDQFRVVQKKLDLFEVWIKLINPNNDTESLSHRLETHILNQLELSKEEIQFNINIVQDIPKEKTGKMRAIISEI
jgi:phenylacetate-CoA ligase